MTERQTQTPELTVAFALSPLTLTSLTREREGAWGCMADCGVGLVHDFLSLDGAGWYMTSSLSTGAGA